MMTIAEDFTVQTEPFRRELLVHCYRMLGSVHDAEDLVQDTMLRAWRSYQSFDEERASLRTWLYRIATNACLTALEQRGRRALPADLSSPAAPDVSELALNGSRRTEVPWLEPFPDALADPASVATGRADIRLAFIAALQYLLPRQRAVLLLREVLGMRAAEVADMLGTSTTAVNSVLQRARSVLREIAPESVSEPSDAVQREVVDRYVTAFVNSDVAGLTRLLARDAIMQMPPVLMWFSGRDDIAGFLSARFSSPAAPARTLLTRANGQHAIAVYRQGAVGSFRPRSIALLGFGPDGMITRIDTFLDTSLFGTFGLPPALGSDRLGSDRLSSDRLSSGP
jgi:RNA polymerase sigma-70 factor (ECF subfamily)